MKTEDLIIKYAVGISKRYRRKEKNFFVNEMGKDFEALGYKVKAVRGYQKKIEGINLVAGDPKTADTIIIANYDTPSHIYGNPVKYYPFNGPASYSSALLPTWTPLIIAGLIGIYILIYQVPHLDFTARFWPSIFWAVMLFVCFISPAFMVGGFANRLNFNRNTSGCIAALKIAEKLDNNKRQHVAFVLTDYGCSRHVGDYILREGLGDAIDRKKVIMLDCVGDGLMWAIGYKEQSKNMAEEISQLFNKKAEIQLCPKEDLRYTSFSFYSKAIIISRVKKLNDSYIVENTSCSKDINCKEKYIEELSDVVSTYIK